MKDAGLVGQLIKRGSPSKPKILIADDDEDILALTSFYFQQAGYQVILASNGREALDKIRQENPALAILDWKMPELNGVEVCRRLRQASNNLYLVLLTARGARDDRITGLQAGADDYITKPFDPQELILRVEGMLRRAKPALSEVQSGKSAVDDFLQLAENVAGQGELVQARELCLQVLKLDPSNGSALRWLGQSSSDPHDAIYYLEKVVEADPTDTSALELLQTTRDKATELDQLIASSGIMNYWQNAEQVQQERLVKGIDRRGSPVLPIGQLLIKKGYITAEQLETALNLQKMLQGLGDTKKLGEILLEYSYLSKEHLQLTLQEQQAEFNSQFY